MPETLRDIVRNTFKEKLAEGRVVSTMMVRLFPSPEIAHIAKSCGFDVLIVDLQHGALSLETTSHICTAALQAGITPFVRVPNYEPEYVSRVLDGGALGIVAPHVSSAADAQKVVANSKFPPLGSRSTGGALPHLRYRSWPEDEMMEVMNEATGFMALIETPAALERVEEIAAVDGVDILMLGVNDMCAGLGIAGQHEHELLRKALMRIIAACRKHGKYVGLGGLSNRKVIAEFVSLGARVVGTGNELSTLMVTGSERVQFIQSLQALP